VNIVSAYEEREKSRLEIFFLIKRGAKLPNFVSETACQHNTPAEYTNSTVDVKELHFKQTQ
jgi:hypothetical protein